MYLNVLRHLLNVPQHLHPPTSPCAYLDVIRYLLSIPQYLHRARVLQDVALAGGQHPQDLVLNLLEPLLVLSASHHLEGFRGQGLGGGV